MAEPATINDIRQILMDDIKSLRNGETTPANVNAVCNAVGKVLQTIKMQMEYAKSVGKMPDIPMLSTGDDAPAESVAKKVKAAA